MPNTFLGLIILVLLFMPGVIFAIVADSRRPAHELSSLRELITIAGAGTICDITVLLIFGLVRLAVPHFGPDIQAIEQPGSSYIRLHAVSVAWWILGLFIFACSLALILGRFLPGIAGRFVSGKIYFTSAWWELFHYQNNCMYYVSCELRDGSYLSGYLLTYSAESDETENREIALAAPIMYRPSGSGAVLEKLGVHTLSISASQIKYLGVAYVEDEAAADQSVKRQLNWSSRRFKLQFTRYNAP